MANVVEYVLKITGGKSQNNIRNVSKELKNTQKDLEQVEKKGKKGFKSLSNSSKSASISLKKLGASFGIVTGAVLGSVAAFVKLNQTVSDSINEIVDASTRSGIATETLAGLRLAAEGSGKSFSDLERGLDNFSKKILDANKDTSQSAKEFKALGVSVKDANGDLKSSNQVFNETIAQLARVEDSTQKNAIAMKLFGRSGSALIQSGAIDDMKNFVGLAKEFGPALDKNAIDKAAEFQRGMALLKQVSVSALQDIMTGITGEASLSSAFKTLATNTKIFASGFVQFVNSMKRGIGGLIDGVDAIASAMGVLEKRPPSQRLVPQSTLDEALTRFGEILPTRGMGKERKAIEFLAKTTGDIVASDRIRQNLRLNSNKLAGKELQIAKETSAILQFLMETRKLTPAEIQKSIDKLIEENKAQSLVNEKLRKQREELEKPISLDLSGLDGENKKVNELSDTVESLFEFVDDQEDVFGLDMFDGAEDAIDIISSLEKKEKDLAKAAQKLNDEIKDSNLEFEGLKKQVESIGEVERPFQDILNDLDETKIRFRELGQSVIPVIDLKMQVLDLRNEIEKLAKMETSVEIAGEVIGLAGGGILESLMTIVGKFLKGDAAKIFKIFSAIVPQVAAFGAEMMKAGEDAVKEVEERREQKEIERLEEAMGRSLTDAEKQRVQNEIKIGEKEKEKISAKAMREKVEFDVRQVALAIEVGLRVLPEILLNVLPPLLLELAFRIVKGIGEAIKNIFHTIFVKNPKDMIDGLKSFFGVDSKRSGGRMISARRGLRFTGSSDTMAQLHRNEFVVPESGARPQAVERIMNQQSGSGINITINADVVERDAIETLVRKIEQRFQNFGTMQSSLFAG